MAVSGASDDDSPAGREHAERPEEGADVRHRGPGQNRHRPGRARSPAVAPADLLCSLIAVPGRPCRPVPPEQRRSLAAGSLGSSVRSSGSGSSFEQGRGQAVRPRRLVPASDVVAVAVVRSAPGSPRQPPLPPDRSTRSPSSASSCCAAGGRSAWSGSTRNGVAVVDPSASDPGRPRLLGLEVAPTALRSIRFVHRRAPGGRWPPPSAPR